MYVCTTDIDHRRRIASQNAGDPSKSQQRTMYLIGLCRTPRLGKIDMNDCVTPGFANSAADGQEFSAMGENSNRAAAEAAVRTLIEWAGDDPDREGLRDTPRRVVRSYEEFFAGYMQEKPNMKIL